MSCVAYLFSIWLFSIWFPWDTHSVTVLSYDCPSENIQCSPNTRLPPLVLGILLFLLTKWPANKAAWSRLNIDTITWTIASRGSIIYFLDISNSSSFTFWSSQFASSSRSNWTSTWIGTSNGTWSDKQSSHFRTAKEIRIKATLFSCTNHNKKFIKWCLNDPEIILN